jgi:hypothetical protein
MKKGRVTIDPALFFLEVKELDITHLARHRSHIYIILLPLIAAWNLALLSHYELQQMAKHLGGS